MTPTTPEDLAREIVGEIIRTTPIAGDFDRTHAIYANELFIDKLSKIFNTQAEQYEARIKANDAVGMRLQSIADDWAEKCVDLRERVKSLEAILEEAREAIDKYLDVSDTGHPISCDLWPNPPKSNKCSCGADVIIETEIGLDKILQKLNSVKKDD